MKNFRRFTALLVFFVVCSSSISAFPHFLPNESAVPANILPNTTAGAWASFQKLSGCHSGQKVSGLSRPKSYFHHFGCIAVNGSSTLNVTDDFDYAFECAVKTYQINFNLTMTSGRAASVSGTVAHYSFFPGKPRWSSRRRNLTYAFEPKNQLSYDVKRVFANAFNRWPEWTPLTFIEKSNYRTADIKIGFYSRNHGDGKAFDGVLGTLAHAFSPPRGLLHVDADETWLINYASGSRPAVNLESVAVHEIGHVLGLGHSSVEEVIMFPTLSSGERRVELSRDDVEGIQVLYGTNPCNNGTRGPSFRKREMSVAHHALPALAQILFTVGSTFFV